MIARLNFHRHEAGLTLVELIVGIALAGLFSALLAMLFVNGLTAQQQTTARDSATGKVNLVSASIATSVRNSTSIRITSAGARLDLKVITPAGGEECRAWALASGQVRYSAGASARSTDTSTWKPLAAGATGTLTAGAAFQLVGTDRVRVGLRISVSGQAVSVTDGVTAQAKGGGSLTC